MNERLIISIGCLTTSSTQPTHPPTHSTYRGPHDVRESARRGLKRHMLEEGFPVLLVAREAAFPAPGEVVREVVGGYLGGWEGVGWVDRSRSGTRGGSLLLLGWVGGRTVMDTGGGSLLSCCCCCWALWWPWRMGWVVSCAAAAVAFGPPL